MTPFQYLPIVLGFALSSGQIASAAAEDAPPKKEETGKQAKLERAQADFKAISAALAMYRVNAGHFPTTAQGLGALINKPVVQPAPNKWVKLMDKHPEDPWNNSYGYIVREKDGKKQVFLISKGPAQDSDKDDIEFEVKVPEAKEKK